LGDEERVAELTAHCGPTSCGDKVDVEKSRPKEDLQLVASSNNFFATAALSVVVDEELCKT
jgi:hypothetical protein